MNGIDLITHIDDIDFGLTQFDHQSFFSNTKCLKCLIFPLNILNIYRR